MSLQQPNDLQGGILYIVATPIGNLGDITKRAIEILGSVDFIAAEDTRHSGILLSTLSIKKPFISYHQSSYEAEDARGAAIIARILSGESCALISDSGTPTISDPGFRLVRAARAAGIKVTAVPGPSAIIAALSISGFPTDRFAFFGFPPITASKKERFLQDAMSFQGTAIIYESPHRIAKLLTMINDAKPDASVCICRELTKIHEEVISGTANAILADLTAKNKIRGEFVLLINNR